MEAERGAGLDFKALPEGLRYGLLLGGSGKPHLAGLASKALGAAGTARLGLDLLLAAWEAGPLDGGLAGALLGLDARAGFLAPGARRAVEACARSWTESGDTALMAGLAASRRHGELASFLADGLEREPGNLFWRQHLLDLSFLLGDWDRAALVLSGPWPPGLEMVRNRFLGDMALRLGDLEAARSHYGQALVLRPARFRLGQALFGMGLGGEAAAQWRKALAAAPWNTDVLCRLHERVSGRDRPGDALEGKVAVCLYTSGKAREVAATLEALLASNLGDAVVVVLDNGSRDQTPAVLAAWKDRAGDILEVVTLPVNVGAPAARNWLMRHPAVAGADYVAYLDDDALVPPDWRAFMARAVRAFPDAGVWGVKVVDLADPGRVQHAEINLLEGDGPEPAFSSLCTQDLDFGQWDRVRPCLSVTGCFHLFRTRTLRECGDFDIRFSPTQYDDLDHDLRLAEKGRTAVCQAHLSVRHARLSGALLGLDPAASGNSAGNLKKLSAKHPPEAMGRARLAMSRVLLGDLLARLGDLERS